MSEERVVVEHPERTQRGARGLSGAIILIGLGVAFLLQNLGIITFDWWSLLRFWPIFLILIGLDLLLARSVLGSILAAMLGLVIIGGVLFLASGPGSGTVGALSGRSVTREVVQEELGNIESLEATINLAASEAHIGVLSGSRYVVEGEYTTDQNLTLETSYDVRGQTGYLTLTQRGQTSVLPFSGSFVGRLDVALTDEVPVDLIINTGAGAITLDLTGMTLSSLTIQGGVGEVRVILPEEGDFAVVVEGGVGSFDVTVPSSLEARVEVSGGLGDVSVPARFESVGERVWTSPEYGSADNNVRISVQGGVGSVRVH